jgi:predicted metallopeptidase
MNSILKIQNVCEKIEGIVIKYNISYIDAVVMYCEKNNIEIESLAKLIKSNSMLKSKLQSEAESLNYLPKSNTLPIEGL